MDSRVRLGIDAGGTLIKIACSEQETMNLYTFPTTRITDAVEWLKERYRDAAVCITGGKGALLRSYLMQYDPSLIVEFEATCKGVQHLLHRSGSTLKAFVLTNAGTGTSVHYVNGEEHSRIGGTGVGGGTLMGLSALLTGIHDYDQIVRTAANGQRDRIDLKVSHIYEGTVPPIAGDLTASNFGNVKPVDGDDGNGGNGTIPAAKVEDALASVIGLVGETVSTVSAFAAGQCGVADIVYIGSSFVDNELLRRTVTGYTELRGYKPCMVENGQFSGAIGALLSL